MRKRFYIPEFKKSIFIKPVVKIIPSAFTDYNLITFGRYPEIIKTRIKSKRNFPLYFTGINMIAVKRTCKQLGTSYLENKGILEIKTPSPLHITLLILPFPIFLKSSAIALPGLFYLQYSNKPNYLFHKS